MLKVGTPITMANYLRIMHDLHFINIKKVIDLEGTLLSEIWKMLDGTDKGTVKAENLLIFLAAILNV